MNVERMRRNIARNTSDRVLVRIDDALAREFYDVQAEMDAAFDSFARAMKIKHGPKATMRVSRYDEAGHNPQQVVYLLEVRPNKEVNNGPVPTPAGSSTQDAQWLDLMRGYRRW